MGQIAGPSFARLCFATNMTLHSSLILPLWYSPKVALLAGARASPGVEGKVCQQEVTDQDEFCQVQLLPPDIRPDYRWSWT